MASQEASPPAPRRRPARHGGRPEKQKVKLCGRAALVRTTPAWGLPLLVAALKPPSDDLGDALLFLLISASIGIVITVAVPRLLLSLPLSGLASVLLLGVAHIQDLEEDMELGVTRLKRNLRGQGHVAGLDSISVVLPCAFEGQFAVKTVRAILANTRHWRLVEIIVVDDGSQPPLREEFPADLPVEELGETDTGHGSSLAAPDKESIAVPIRILRHERTMGLVAAKKAGGDAAQGDVIVFLDCHVKPRMGWEEAFLRQMQRAGDHRTIVVPAITSLDPGTWEEKGEDAGVGKACFMMLNADFTWLPSSGRDVPMASGGLLGMSRRWWEETGGYDEHMLAWGGENIDQSLRTWLCGGRIEVAEGAFIAHMWRDARDPRTALKYPIPTEHVMRNKARAVAAWFDEFRNKTFDFPEYEAFVTGQQGIGEMTGYADVKEHLHCKPFSAYIARFSYIYVDSGLLPKEVFQLRETSSGLCLERHAQLRPPHGVVLAPCADTTGLILGGPPGDAASKTVSGVPELQLWHPGNRDRGLRHGPCCSGIMNWNFLQCLNAADPDGALTTTECDIGGHMRSQRFALGAQRSAEDPGVELQWGGGTRCAAPEEEADPPAACDTRSEAVLESGFAGEALDTFRLHTASVNSVDDDEPGAGGAGEQPDRANDAASSGVVVSAGGDNPGVGREWVCCDQEGAGSSLHTCAKGEVPSRFRSRPVLGGYEIRLEAPEPPGGRGSQLCLDGVNGAFVPKVTKCSGDGEGPSGGRSQVWHIDQGQLVWEGITRHHQPHYGWMRACLHVGATEPALRHLGDVVRPALRTCADRKGQRLRKDDARDDGSFLLRDADRGECLGRNPDESSHGAVVLGSCSDGQRWKEVPEQDQVLHVASDLCLDAGDEKTPILHQCHGGRTHRKQRFTIVESPPSVRLRPAWEDNGRRRFFEQCVDWAPARLKRVVVQPCRQVRSRHVHWEKISAHVPYETRLWQQAAKPAKDDPVLGGDAAPP